MDEAAVRRWQTMTVSEQLANVGSEVERAIRARDDVPADSAKTMKRYFLAFAVAARSGR